MITTPDSRCNSALFKVWIKFKNDALFTIKYRLTKTCTTFLNPATFKLSDHFPSGRIKSGLKLLKCLAGFNESIFYTPLTESEITGSNPDPIAFATGIDWI